MNYIFTKKDLLAYANGLANDDEIGPNDELLLEDDEGNLYRLRDELADEDETQSDGRKLWILRIEYLQPITQDEQLLSDEELATIKPKGNA